MTVSRMNTCGVMVRMERELEIALVERLRAGDVLAFDAVYDDYNPRLLGFLLRMTKIRADAEDLLEEPGCDWFPVENSSLPTPVSGHGYSPWHATCF